MQAGNGKRWAAVGVMLAVLCVMFAVTPKGATSFALVILLTFIGFGYQRGAFSLSK